MQMGKIVTISYLVKMVGDTQRRTIKSFQRDLSIPAINTNHYQTASFEYSLG